MPLWSNVEKYIKWLTEDETLELHVPKSVQEVHPDVPRGEMPQTVDETAAAGAEPQTDVVIDSASLAEQRLKYIVGKTSGQDIVTADGTVIAAKGDVITADIVRRAVAAGKLVDLIVHMTVDTVTT